MSDLNLELSQYPDERVEISSIKKRVGLIVTCALGGSLVALYAVAAPFVAPALRKICVPFVPATSTQVSNVISVFKTRPGSLVDIGSGDGRIVSPFHSRFLLN